MNDFLPIGYKEPETSNYMKLEEGENRFRVLGSAIVGLEYWKTIEGKRTPIRVHLNDKVEMSELEENPKTGELNMPRVFWAFPVWNYKSEKIQVLELTQKTIRDAIKSLVANKKWGSPMDYDIVVVRDESTGKTKYTTTPDPKEPVDEKIAQMFKTIFIDLNKLYEGKNPFVNEEVAQRNEDINPEDVKI